MKTALPEDISRFRRRRGEAARPVRAGRRRRCAPRPTIAFGTRRGVRLADIGAFELDVRSASDDMLAAAVLCQAAGATALPYPLVEELLAIDGARLALVNPEAPRIDHGDLPGDWIAADLDGMRYHPQPASRTNAKLGPFLVPATLSAPDGTVPAADVDLHLVLGSWRILGAMQQALEISPSTSRAHPVRQAAGGIPGGQVHRRGRVRRGARTSRTREVHPLPSGIATGSNAFGRRARTEVQGRRHRAAGATHLPSVARRAGFLRRVRRQRARPAHPTADPACRSAAEALALRLIPDVRDGYFETLFSGPVSA